MTKGILTSLDFGMFPGRCLFVYGYTYNQLIKELNKQKCKELVAGIEGEMAFIDSTEYCALHRKVGKSHLYYIIINRKFKFTDEHYATIAHECLHICQFYLPRILDRNKEHEAEAYLHTHLMVQCLAHLRKVERYQIRAESGLKVPAACGDHELTNLCCCITQLLCEVSLMNEDLLGTMELHSNGTLSSIAKCAASLSILSTHRLPDHLR